MVIMLFYGRRQSGFYWNAWSEDGKPPGNNEADEETDQADGGAGAGTKKEAGKKGEGVKKFSFMNAATGPKRLPLMPEEGPGALDGFFSKFTPGLHKYCE